MWAVLAPVELEEPGVEEAAAWRAAFCREGVLGLAGRFADGKEEPRDDLAVVAFLLKEYGGRPVFMGDHIELESPLSDDAPTISNDEAKPNPATKKDAIKQYTKRKKTASTVTASQNKSWNGTE